MATDHTCCWVTCEIYSVSATFFFLSRTWLSKNVAVHAWSFHFVTIIRVNGLRSGVTLKDIWISDKVTRGRKNIWIDENSYLRVSGVGRIWTGRMSQQESDDTVRAQGEIASPLSFRESNVVPHMEALAPREVLNPHSGPLNSAAWRGAARL